MEHTIHDSHGHVHGDCEHVAVRHGDHVDHLHDGHLHSAHGDHVDEHAVANDATNPARCTPSHTCGAHDASHAHGSGCGHERVPHAGHEDYLVAGHLHRVHTGHCDDHGVLAKA
jgi:hypothetical protein